MAEAPQLLEHLSVVCSQRSDGYWELLATAAAEKESVQKTIQGLQIDILKMGLPAAGDPVMAEERVLALSVSNEAELQLLFNQWQNMYDRQEISQDEAWLIRAWGQAKRYFSVYQCNFESPSWSWSQEFTAFSERGRLLSQRPLEEKYLSVQDFINAIDNGAGVLRALRTQQVELDSQIFDYYSRQVEFLDSYHLALLIELSRRTNFSQEIWIEEFLKVMPKITNPLYLTPAVYCLLNSDWCVP